MVRPGWDEGLRPEINKPHLNGGGTIGGSGGFHFHTTNRSAPPPLPKSSRQSPARAQGEAESRIATPDRSESPSSHSRSRSPRSAAGAQQRLRQAESIIKALRDEKVLFEAKLAEVENGFAHHVADLEFELAERTRELDLVLDESLRRGIDLRAWLREQTAQGTQGAPEDRSPGSTGSPRREPEMQQAALAREQAKLQETERRARKEAQERKKAKQQAKREEAERRKALAKASAERKRRAAAKKKKKADLEKQEKRAQEAQEAQEAARAQRLVAEAEAEVDSLRRQLEDQKAAAAKVQAKFAHEKEQRRLVEAELNKLKQDKDSH